MFSFTNPELVHETILTNYLAVLTLDDSPIDKLKLLMSVSGKIIEEFNGYVTPPKKDNTVSILLLEKEKDIFISPKVSDETVIKYISDKFTGSYTLKLSNPQPVTFYDINNGSYLKIFLNKKKMTNLTNTRCHLTELVF